MSKIIKLSQNKETIVDDEDYDLLKKLNWYYHNCGYACRKEKIQGKWKTILLHRQLLNPPSELCIDHINSNRLDNQKINLRIVTNKQNSRNSRKQKGTTSKYKGVYWFKRVSKWMARIRVDYKWIQIGYFLNEEDAAKAYNEAALKYFGEYAKINNVKEIKNGNE